MLRESSRRTGSEAEIIGEFDTRHGSLAYSSRGHGPSLLLLPANGHASRDFDAVRPALCQDFQTIAVDWPSVGASPALGRPEDASAALFAEMVEDVVSSLGNEVILVGHSVGGFAATRAAARMPERVVGLLIVDAGGFAPLGATGRWFCRVKGTPWVTARVEGAFARWHAKRRNPHVAAMFARIDVARQRRDYAETVAAVWRSFTMPEHDLRSEATAVCCRTLVVWGARDPVLPAARAGAAAARLIPNAQSVVLDTGHSPFVEAPEEFLEVAGPFLQSLHGKTAGNATEMQAQLEVAAPFGGTMLDS